MSTQPVSPAGMNLRGAVDLSGLRRPTGPADPSAAAGAPAPSGAAGPSLPSPVLDVTVQTFERVIQLSTTVPVVVDLWTPRSPGSEAFSASLAATVREYDGRILLARVDADAEPQIVAAFGVQQVPAVMAVLAGQPLPLFEGAVPQAQVRQLFDQLLTVAAQQGVTGKLTITGDGIAAGADEESEPVLPPLHAEAYAAIERDDMDAAADAYRRALVENPADSMASAGLAQVELYRRTRGADLEAAREKAAQDLDDVDAALMAADLDLLGGHAEDAFARLVDTVRRTSGEERDKVRLRLVELFSVVGVDDPRVVLARRALANALF